MAGSNGINKTLMVNRPRTGMSRGFAEFESRKRRVEVISASKKWIKYIKSWKHSFDPEVGDLNQYRIYRFKPQIFEKIKIIGRLWGALVVEQEIEAATICRLGDFGDENQPRMVVKLVLMPKKKEKKKNGQGSTTCV